jgi:hypothetical protein
LPSATQRELAAALTRVGDVLQSHGQVAAAQAAFDESLAINRQLAEQGGEQLGEGAASL